MFLLEYTCALLKYFKAVKTTDGKDSNDPESTCLKLKWETQNNLYKLAEVDTLFRVVHIVPNWSSEGSSSNNLLLNRFLFR